jgi:hypothetical protein
MADIAAQLSDPTQPTTIHLASIPKGMLRDPHSSWVLGMNPVPIGVRLSWTDSPGFQVGAAIPSKNRKAGPWTSSGMFRAQALAAERPQMHLHNIGGISPFEVVRLHFSMKFSGGLDHDITR